MPTRTQRLFDWLDARLPVSVVRDAARHKTVPVHRYSVVYYFGGMTLFFFLVQVTTGILLMLYYRPSADEAFESVEFLMTTVPVRLADPLDPLLVGQPDGVLRLRCTWSRSSSPRPTGRPASSPGSPAACCSSWPWPSASPGYLLPWNQLAFFATKVGTEIAAVVPGVGEWMVRFLRGGDRVTGATLSRFYGWHVAILPAITALLLGLHLLLVQLHGMSVPPDREKEAARRRAMRFFPHFALRDLFGWLLALGVLAALAALFPWELGEKADPFAPAYADIRPEWYFMFMFQTLKLVPGGEILGLEYEAIPILLLRPRRPGAAAGAVPRPRRRAARPQPRLSPRSASWRWSTWWR